MKKMPFVIPAALACALAACYNSSTTTGDATGDTPNDDGRTDGVDTPDIECCDDRDADEDTDGREDLPPAQYTLHEWGVVVMGDEGAATFGPSPEFSGPIPAKPVIYLYSDGVIGPVDISIDFASGGATEVWPETTLSGRVSWYGLTLTPGACAAPTPFPVPWDPYPTGDTYCEACALGTCVVSGTSCLRYTTSGGTSVSSNLLFYTGRLPLYTPPLSAYYDVPLCSDGDCLAFNVSNSSTRFVEDVWIVYRQTESACVDPSLCPLKSADIAWTHVDAIPAGTVFTRTLPVTHLEVPVDEYGHPTGDLELPEGWKGLGADLAAELVARGLTAQETEAFMTNWNTLFFGLLGSDSMYVDPLYENGAFVISFMPPEDYNSQLALRANPSPKQSTRVGMIYQKAFIPER